MKFLCSILCLRQLSTDDDVMMPPDGKSVIVQVLLPFMLNEPKRLNSLAFGERLVSSKLSISLDLISFLSERIR